MMSRGNFLLSRRNPFWLEGTIDSEQNALRQVLYCQHIYKVFQLTIPSQPEGDLLVLDCKKVNDLGAIKMIKYNKV